jgi:PelA/Pel-15E family pectate lyase
MKTSFLSFLMMFFCFFSVQAQKKSWREVIFKSDDVWYQSEEAKLIADNVLIYQRDIGGWPKNLEMQNKISSSEITSLEALKKDPNGCTIDNGATVQEMIFLSKVYQFHPEEKYKFGFIRGLLYLITSQYKNGGWPQFYPLKEGYYTHITFNDDAMVNVLNLFKEIAENKKFNTIEIGDDLVNKVKSSLQKGIDVILKTQYKQNGVLTAWCAQHDKETLLPAKARAYELESLSGKESAKIVLFLMSIQHPSDEIKVAIQSAVEWFEKSKIEGYKLETVTIGNKKQVDKILVEAMDAEPMWARFMELDNNRPFFCDRSGKKKYSIAEISLERRMGYGWYTYEPKEVLKKYKAWKEKHF